MSRREVYSAFETEASLCVFEWLSDQYNDKKSRHRDVVEEMWTTYGSSAMRFIAMQAGCIVVSMFNETAGDASEFAHLFGDDDSFDWDFVPMICARLPWAELAMNNQYGNGEWVPETKEFLAIIVAQRAIGVTGVAA